MTNEDVAKMTDAELADESRAITRRLEELPLNVPIPESELPSERVKLHRRQAQIEEERRKRSEDRD